MDGYEIALRSEPVGALSLPSYLGNSVCFLGNESCLSFTGRFLDVV